MLVYHDDYIMDDDTWLLVEGGSRVGLLIWLGLAVRLRLSVWISNGTHLSFALLECRIVHPA